MEGERDGERRGGRRDAVKTVAYAKYPGQNNERPKSSKGR